MAASAEHIFPNETVRSLGDIGFDEDNWGVGVSGVVESSVPVFENQPFEGLVFRRATLDP